MSIKIQEEFQRNIDDDDESVDGSDIKQKRQRPFEIAKAKIGFFLNHKIVQLFMLIISLYALMGNDVQMLAFEKKDDGVFMVLNVITIVLFIIDIILSTIAIQDYVFSFLFWVDIISTASIVLDLESVQKSLIGYDFEL